MSSVVFWDLDGTLLTTDRAGVAALEDASEHVLGRRADLSGMKTAGMTDREIAAVVVAHAIGAQDDALAAAFLQHYAAALPDRLEQRRGRVMPNVLAILDACSRTDGVVVGLLTGNIECGARAKLTSYGIRPETFAFGGYAEDGLHRTEIGAVAVARSGGLDAWDAAYLVGDTPSDVSAGKALDLRTIAVATGVYTVAELENTGAWVVLDELPAAAEFMAMVTSP